QGSRAGVWQGQRRGGSGWGKELTTERKARGHKTDTRSRSGRRASAAQTYIERLRAGQSSIGNRHADNERGRFGGGRGRSEGDIDGTGGSGRNARSTVVGR